MRVRLVMLVVVAGALAVLFAVRASAPKAEPPMPEDPLSAEERKRLEDLQIMPWDRDWKCEKTTIPADLSIRLEADTTGKKNRLYYYITEVHGFFVETFNVTFYYKPTPDSTPDDSPYTFDQLLPVYLPANETLKGCIEVVERELELFEASDGIGTSENWGAEIVYYHSACTSDPDPLPPQIVLQCRD